MDQCDTLSNICSFFIERFFTATVSSDPQITYKFYLKGTKEFKFCHRELKVDFFYLFLV